MPMTSSLQLLALSEIKAVNSPALDEGELDMTAAW